MNTGLFNRRAKGLNPLLRLFQRSHKPFSRFRKETPVDNTADSAIKETNTPAAPVRLSPGTYRPREENTTFTDRQSALRYLVAHHLGVSLDAENDEPVLSGNHFSRQALLDLIAAIDLEFGVYVEPEQFDAEFTFSQLSNCVFPNQPGARADHET